MDIEYAKKLTGCVAALIGSHASQPFFDMAPVGVAVQDPKRRRKSARELASKATSATSQDGCGCLQFRDFEHQVKL
jgi:hypothetical protein